MDTNILHCAMYDDRSVFERALDVDYRNQTLWLKYAVRGRYLIVYTYICNVLSITCELNHMQAMENQPHQYTYIHIHTYIQLWCACFTRRWRWRISSSIMREMFGIELSHCIPGWIPSGSSTHTWKRWSDARTVHTYTHQIKSINTFRYIHTNIHTYRYDVSCASSICEHLLLVF